MTKPSILFVLNGHKYVSYFFEPMAKFARKKGLSVNLALSEDGSYEASQWPVDTEPLRFSVNRLSKNPFRLLKECLQKPIVGEQVDIVHLVSSRIILVYLVRLVLRLEKPKDALVVFHFIGLGRALGTNGFFSRMVSALLSILWQCRPRKGLTYRLVYLNDADFRKLLTIFGEKNIRYLKVPGAGVRQERFELNILPNRPPIKLLYVGRLIKEKGVELFIQLIARANKEQTLPVKGVIVGGFEDRYFKSKIEDLVRELGVSEKIRFAGETANPSPYYGDAHFFVFPSTYGEGVPTVLLEAQYCGTPCLASNIAGCREAVLDGVTGRIVSLMHVDEWYKVLVELAAAEDYERMAMEAHLRAKDMFCADKLARLTVDWVEGEFYARPSNRQTGPSS